MEPHINSLSQIASSLENKKVFFLSSFLTFASLKMALLGNLLTFLLVDRKTRQFQSRT